MTKKKEPMTSHGTRLSITIDEIIHKEPYEDPVFEYGKIVIIYPRPNLTYQKFKDRMLQAWNEHFVTEFGEHHPKLMRIRNGDGTLVVRYSNSKRYKRYNENFDLLKTLSPSDLEEAGLASGT